MALHRTAIVSCAALIALMLAAALLVRGGGGDGPFHVIETTATPTVEVAGLPALPTPAARAERADLGQLAMTTVVLLLLAALTVLVTLLGVIGSENLAQKGRRVIEVMLGAPPGWLVGAAARLWRRRLVVAGVMGGGLCAAVAVVWLVRAAPPGTETWHGRAGGLPPRYWSSSSLQWCSPSGVAPVWRLYSREKDPFRGGRAARQLHRPAATTIQPDPPDHGRAVRHNAVAILASSGLLVLSSTGRPVLPGEVGTDEALGDGAAAVGAGQTVSRQAGVPGRKGAADSASAGRDLRV